MKGPTGIRCSRRPIGASTRRKGRGATSSSLRNRNHMDRIFAAAAALALGLALPAAAQDAERDVSRHVEALRAMQPDNARSDEYNREMDDAWKDFDARRAKSLPLLRATLIAETKRADPSQMVLLDIGYY